MWTETLVSFTAVKF